MLSIQRFVNMVPVHSKGILIATAVNEEGQREVMGFEVGDSETYESWAKLL